MRRITGAAFLALPLALGARAAEAASELEGTWYVLIHYQDVNTAHPDAMRWLDLVWNFDAAGDRLTWTQYPLVVFDDEEGRFEMTRGGRVRTLAAWEPDEPDWSYLADGPRINSRGSKKKSLRGSDGGGWTSGQRRSSRSVNVFTYEEIWSISPTSENPVFAIGEVLDSGDAEGDEDAQTRFAVQKKMENELRGTFDRDGTRTGTFRMVRVGPIRALKSTEDGVARTQSLVQKSRETLLATLEQQMASGKLDTKWPWEEEEQGRFPFIGATLPQVIQGLRERPEAEIQVLLQKLRIFRVDTNPWQELEESQALTGEIDPAGIYAVMANRLCRSRGEKESRGWISVDWFLLPKNALAAYEFDQLSWQCVQFPVFHPASGPLAETERRVTHWMSEKFPKEIVHPIFFYFKGLSYLRVDRVSDAESMLAQGEASMEHGTRLGTIQERTASGHEDVTGRTEEEMLKKALTRGISRARGPAAEPLPKE